MSDETPQTPGTPAAPEAPDAHAAPEVREGLLLPVLLPVGGLVVIVLVLFLFSRVLLRITHDAATVVACITAAAIITVASTVSSRKRLTGAALLPMIGTIFGIALVAGGVAMVAIGPEKEAVEPLAVTLTAPTGAATKGFQPTSLKFQAELPTALTFDNQDPNVSHNMVIFSGKDATGATVFTGALTSGPSSTPYSVPGLPAGNYFFHCEVHPTTMTGTINVQVAAPPGSGSPAPTGPVITATALQFNTAQLAMPANTPTDLQFTNNDPGTQHNVDIFKDSSYTTSVFKGDLITGPDTVTYNVPALPAATYYFKCDVHPTMTGTLTVAPAPGGGGSGTPSGSASP
jgi:plastocyanin